MESQNKNKYKVFALAAVLALAGCSDDDTSDFGNKPVADFTASETSVEQGTTVTFTDISTNAPSLYTWQFDGGSPTYSNQPSPQILYVVKGKHAVTLTVRNNAGADEIKKTEYIVVNAPPIEDINVVPLVKLGFETNLDNEGSIGTAAMTAAGGVQYELRTYKGGLAVVLNGSTHLTIPGYTGINGNNPRSVTCWVKTTHNGTSGLIHWGATGTKSRSSFKYQNTGQIRYEYQGGGITGVKLINDDKWHHVAYTFNGATIRLYVDGEEDVKLDAVIDTGVSGQTDVNIGSQLGASIFKGALDDVRIYDVALTPEQIVTLSKIM